VRLPSQKFRSPVALLAVSFVQGRIAKVAAAVAHDLAIYLETNHTFCFFGQYK